MNSSAHNAKKPLIDIISFKAAFLFFSFQKGRYFTVYKRRNKRHSESQTLYLFVEAKACRNSGFSYGTHEILTLCENLSFLVASLQREEADSLHQLAVKPTAATKFGARCATLGTTNFMCVLYDLRMCVHGYTHTHTHTHKQTHTQTHI